MYNVTIGAYAQVLFILGLEKDLLNKSKPKKAEQKKLFNSLSLRWWDAVYDLLDKVIYFLEELFILVLSKALSFMVLLLSFRPSLVGLCAVSGGLHRAGNGDYASLLHRKGGSAMELVKNPTPLGMLRPIS